MNSRATTAGLALAGLAVLLALPHGLKYHHQDMLIFVTINVLVVASYRLVTLSGEWSLIHAVMMGVGAYAAGLAFRHLDWQIWLTLPLAGLASAAMAAVLSVPLFRTTQFYFLIGSFAAGEAIRLSWIYFLQPFGGTSGLSGIEPPLIGGIDFLEPVPYYYLCLAVVGLCLLVLWRIERSRIGLTLHAVHWQPALAESIGVDTVHYRSLAFVLGSAFVGVAGALKAHYLGTITPKQFDIAFMVFILIWVVVGGYSRFFGPIVGVVVLSVLDESIRSLEQWRPAIYGLLLIAAIRFLPKGLESLLPLRSAGGANGARS